MPAPQINETGQVQSGAGLPWRIARGGRRLIVWTDFLADVATIDMGAHEWALRFGNRRAQLDREIRQAASRIEDTRFDQRIRRAGFEAARAAAALLQAL